MSVPLNYPINGKMPFNPNDPNKTNIIFDDKLKRFIPKAICHMNRLFPKHKIEYDYLEMKQLYLKQYVTGHRRELTLIRNVFTQNMMADMFAICVCMLIGDISMYGDWEDIDVQSVVAGISFRKRTIAVDGVGFLKCCKIVSGGLENGKQEKRDCCCGRKKVVSKNIFLSQTQFYSVLFGGCCFKKITIELRDGGFDRAVRKAIKKEIDDEIAERRAIRRLMKQVFKQILSQKQRRNKIKEVELEDTTREEEQKLRRRFCDYDIVFDHELIEDSDGVIIEMKLVWSAKLKPQNRRRN